MGGWRAMPAWVPQAIGVAVLLPVAMVWFGEAWRYQRFSVFIPAILLTAVLTLWRWPRGEDRSTVESGSGSLLWMVGMIAGVTGLSFSIPWFCVLSVLALTASALGQVYDQRHQSTLLSCAYPLLVCGVLPASYDFRLAAWAQSLSLRLGGRVMDFVGAIHDTDGIALRTDLGDTYDFQTVATTAPSLHWLALLALGIAAWRRTPLFQTALLLLSAFFWRIFLLAMLMMSVLVAKRNLQTDIWQGQTVTLFVVGMILGFVLLLSSAQFIRFLAGPVDDFDEGTGLGRRILRFWNSFVSGVRKQESRRQRSSESADRNVATGLGWIAAAILVVGGVIRLPQAVMSLTGDSVRPPVTEKSALPETLGPWAINDFDTATGAPGGIASRSISHWDFSGPAKNHLHLMLDDFFLGWHHLLHEPRMTGWKLVDQTLVNPPAEPAGGGDPWSLVVVELKRPSGERMLLLYSMFDQAGAPLPARLAGSPLREIPGWFLEHLWRMRLPRAVLVRAQFRTFKAIDAELRQEVTDQYLAARELLRTARTGSAGAN